MLFKNSVQKSFNIIILLITFLLSAATSIPHSYFSVGKFNVISDCASDNIEETVDISDYTIINPTSLSFLDFGFPVIKITPDQDMTGTVNGVTRVCKRTFGGEFSDSEILFSCEDNGAYTCSIVIQSL